jgi:hypothetical protein
MAHASRRLLGLGLVLSIGALLSAGCVLVPVPGPEVVGPAIVGPSIVVAPPVYRAPRAVIRGPVAPAYGPGRYHRHW